MSRPRLVAMFGYWRLVRVCKGEFVLEERGEDALGRECWTETKRFADGNGDPPELPIYRMIALMERLARRRRRRLR